MGSEADQLKSTANLSSVYKDLTNVGKSDRLLLRSLYEDGTTNALRFKEGFLGDFAWCRRADVYHLLGVADKGQQ